MSLIYTLKTNEELYELHIDNKGILFFESDNRRVYREMTMWILEHDNFSMKKEMRKRAEAFVEHLKEVLARIGQNIIKEKYEQRIV
jgi:hypothetical protein